MIIYEDAGHGGTDPGACANGLQEKDLTLKITLHQIKRFKEHGFQVISTRENDSTVDLNLRRSNVSKSGAKICISNHINAGGGVGAEVWRSIKFNTGWGEKIINEFIKLGWKTHGQGVKTKPSTKYPGYDYFAMNNVQPVEGIIIEYFFIDSNDVYEIGNRWQELSEAVVKATVEYLGIKYVPIGNKEEYIMNLEKISILIKNKKLEGYLIDGKSYVPARDLVETLNFTIEWQEKEKTVIIK